MIVKIPNLPKKKDFFFFFLLNLQFQRLVSWGRCNKIYEYTEYLFVTHQLHTNLLKIAHVGFGEFYVDRFLIKKKKSQVDSERIKKDLTFNYGILRLNT